MFKAVLLSILLFITLSLQGQIAYKSSNWTQADTVFNNKAFQTLDVPLILGAVSGISFHRSEDIQNIRQFNMPQFRYHYDDYLQYAPAVAKYVMKLAGVKSRSSWGNMVIADAFSVGIMAGLVNGMKYSVKRLRPDLSSHNSYPSGHTATAFLAASLFHKEYGHLSPWYSAAAYTCASLVGVTRVMNNRHWLSDVLAGAGIGIMSVELGYIISDAIMKVDKKQDFFSLDFRKSKPSYVGLKHAYNEYLGTYAYKGGDLNFENSSSFCVEGAWYMHQNWGVVANLGASTADLARSGNQIATTLGTYGMGLGPTYSLGFTSRFYFDARLMLGAIIESRENEFRFGDEFTAGVGVGLTYMPRKNLGMRGFVDYSVIPNFVGSQLGQVLSMGLLISFML